MFVIFLLLNLSIRLLASLLLLASLHADAGSLLYASVPAFAGIPTVIVYTFVSIMPTVFEYFGVIFCFVSERLALFYHNHSALGGGKKALTYIRVPETIHKINVLAWGHLPGLKEEAISIWRIRLPAFLKLLLKISHWSCNSNMGKDL
jgi:hypothetical protein